MLGCTVESGSSRARFFFPWQNRACSSLLMCALPNETNRMFANTNPVRPELIHALTSAPRRSLHTLAAQRQLTAGRHPGRRNTLQPAGGGVSGAVPACGSCHAGPPAEARPPRGRDAGPFAPGPLGRLLCTGAMRAGPGPARLHRRAGCADHAVV